MVSRKRAQTGFEFMVTYGWAIIILIIGLVILWNSGMFNPFKWRGNNECGGFSQFTCIDQFMGLNQTGIVLGNAVNRAIIVDSVTITGDGAPSLCNGDSGIGPAPARISPDGIAYIECQVSTTLVRGGQYEFEIQIGYRNIDSGISKSDNGGFIRGKVG